jgi:type VI secretion system secreted protein VgrG
LQNVSKDFPHPEKILAHFPHYRFDEPERISEPFEHVPFLTPPVSFTQDGLTVAVTSALEENDLLFDAFIGKETLCELFEFQLRFYSKKTDLDIKKLIGTKLSLCVNTLKTKTQRYFSGIVVQAQALSSYLLDPQEKTYLAYYAVTLRPDFWISTLSQNFRIFTKKTAKDIIESVLKEDNVTFSNKASSLGTVQREYCLQYGESNFAFVSRLMEEEGIFYFFTHSASGAEMVLAGENKSATAISNSCSMDVVRPDTLNMVTVWQAQEQIVAKKMSVIDYDYMKPSTELKGSESGESKGGEVYEYPGGFIDSDGAGKAAKRRLEETNWAASLAFGRSGVLEFGAGCSFKLEKHSRTELNQKYLIYSCEHHFFRRLNKNASEKTKIPPFLYNTEESRLIYENRVTVLPEAVPFVPLRKTPKPKVFGVQTAVVVGPDDKEIHSDPEGRVYIQFVWDREGQKDGKDSLAVRCMQGWAGAGFGLAFVPRVGMEVVVSFENGDPDKPLIVGCVYNGDNKMPEAVTKEPRIAMLKTKTSPENEDKAHIFSIDDTKEAEKITVNVTKDLEISSLAKENIFLLKQEGEKTTNQLQITEGLLETTINKGERKFLLEEGNDSAILKKGSLTLELEDGDKVLTIKKGNYIINIKDGELTITTKKDITIKTDAGVSVTAAKDIALKSDANITLKATKNVTIEGSDISLTAQKNITEKATADYTCEAKAINQKANTDVKVEGLNISQKATLEAKREGLNIADKAQIGLKGEGLTVAFKGTVSGELAGLMASLKGDATAEVKGGAMAAIAGALTALG